MKNKLILLKIFFWLIFGYKTKTIDCQQNRTNSEKFFFKKDFELIILEIFTITQLFEFFALKQVSPSTKTLGAWFLRINGAKNCYDFLHSTRDPWSLKEAIRNFFL